MTARRRLVPEGEVKSMIELFRKHGLPIGSVDIRSDGVTIHPPAGTSGSPSGNPYDDWKAKDQDR